MKIPRMDASRRPAKPVSKAAGQVPAAMAPVEPVGGVPDGDWVRVRVDWIAAPQGSHKQGFGKSVRETNPKTEPYRQAVADACEAEMDNWVWKQLDGYLEVRLDFYMPPPPKSDPDRRFPNTPPDIDKLVRSTFDGISRSKMWKDDARVVGMTVWEYFAPSLEETHVDIAIREVP